MCDCCKIFYGADQNGKCVKCELEFCASCFLDASSCVRCSDDGYLVNSSHKTCAECDVKNCVNCSMVRIIAIIVKMYLVEEILSVRYVLLRILKCVIMVMSVTSVLMVMVT